MRTSCAKYTELLRRESLGGRLFGVKTDIVVGMLETLELQARLIGQLDLIDRLLAGESARDAFEALKADAEREFAKFMAEKEIALKG